MAPELMKLYSWLGFYTTQIAVEKGTIDNSAMEEFQRVFRRELTRAVPAS